MTITIYALINGRIMSFCTVAELKRLEIVCKVWNNSEEVHQIVATIRQGVVGKKTKAEIAAIRAALIHLCYMTEELRHQADVSFVCIWDHINHIELRHSMLHVA